MARVVAFCRCCLFSLKVLPRSKQEAIFCFSSATITRGRRWCTWEEAGMSSSNFSWEFPTPHVSNHYSLLIHQIFPWRRERRIPGCSEGRAFWDQRVLTVCVADKACENILFSLGSPVGWWLRARKWCISMAQMRNDKFFSWVLGQSDKCRWRDSF